MKKEVVYGCGQPLQRIGRLGKNTVVRRLMPMMLLLLLASCFSTKKINYIQSDKPLMIIPNINTDYKVQINDILNIDVKSRDPELTLMYNTNTGTNTNIQPNPASLFLSGYTIDQEGMINLPNVGKIAVVGMRVEEIRDLVQTEIDKYLLNALVSVKLTSFKISVLGDVKNPGTNYIYNTRANIFEALSAAGDLNLSADPKEVKLIRQLGNASKVVNLDLTDAGIMQSPYYFLHPNDVLYVQTSKPNIADKNRSLWALVLSAITTTVLVLNFTSN